MSRTEDLRHAWQSSGVHGERDKALQLLESGYGFLSVGRAAALSVALLHWLGCVSGRRRRRSSEFSQSQQITAEAQTAASETEGEAPGEQVAATDSASEQTAGPTAGSGQDAAGPAAGADDAEHPPQRHVFKHLRPIARRARRGKRCRPKPDFGATPGGNARPTVNATSNSLFNGGQAADEQPVLQPQQRCRQRSSSRRCRRLRPPQPSRRPCL